MVRILSDRVGEMVVGLSEKDAADNSFDAWLKLARKRLIGEK